jgi:tetratricopeptide (TPR) repeat protein
MFHSLRLWAILLVTVALCRTSNAEDKDKAREAYRAATHHYDFGEYQQALDGFKQAYEHYEDAAFLFNIAQCHRALGHKQEAVTFYKSYLRNSPDAPNRDEVKQIITELESALSHDKASAKREPGSTTTPGPLTVTPATSQPPVATTLAAPTTEKPARKRTWLWGVAAGVVVVGVAVGLGVGLGIQPHPPRPTYGTVSF